MVHLWQLIFCDQNQCAAFLLANFEHWHLWKLKTDSNNKKLNDIAEQHGEQRRMSEDVWLFKSLQGLSDAILNLFGIKTINEALKLLERKGAISIHSTPNKNHHYDKRKYFRFYPEVCNEWLKIHYTNQKNADSVKDRETSVKIPNASGIFTDTSDEQVVLSKNSIKTPMDTDAVKVPSAFGKNVDTLRKNTDSINEFNINNKNKLININNNFIDETKHQPILESRKEVSDSQNQNNENVQEVIRRLIELGFPSARLQYPDTVKNIEDMLLEGASINTFIEAYIDTCRIKGEELFAFNYLLKVVKTRLERENKKKNHIEPVKIKSEINTLTDESNFTQSIHWMED